MGHKIYFDTNQLYFIRRIADEAEGFEYGDYSWAYDIFPNNPKMVADIKALCYIMSLQYQWDLEFCSSDASYTELFLTVGNRAVKTREVWEIVAEHNLDKKVRKLTSIQESGIQNRLDLEHVQDILGFISDKSDREIIRDFLEQAADTLLTSDDDILRHKAELGQLGVRAMRPHEWINEFLKDERGDEDGVDWVERILFTIGS
jgi:predicted nucleic acid-binding protein